jgi:hypothetical protein
MGALLSLFGIGSGDDIALQVASNEAYKFLSESQQFALLASIQQARLASQETVNKSTEIAASMATKSQLALSLQRSLQNASTQNQLTIASAIFRASQIANSLDIASKNLASNETFKSEETASLETASNEFYNSQQTASLETASNEFYNSQQTASLETASNEFYNSQQTASLETASNEFYNSQQTASNEFYNSQQTASLETASNNFLNSQQTASLQTASNNFLNSQQTASTGAFTASQQTASTGAFTASQQTASNLVFTKSQQTASLQTGSNNFLNSQLKASNNFIGSLQNASNNLYASNYAFHLRDFINLLIAKPPICIYQAERFDSTKNMIPNLISNRIFPAAICTNVTLSNVTGNGATVSIPQLSGSTSSNIYFPEGSIPASNTVCSITRYSSSSNQRRILQGFNINWLHGHNNLAKGQAYYNNWVTSSSQPTTLTTPKTDWLVMCGGNRTTDQTNGAHILADGNSVGIVQTNLINKVDRLVINPNSSGEKSDFGFSQVIVWNQQLTNIELAIVNKALRYYLNFPTIYNAELNNYINRFNASQNLANSAVNFLVKSVEIVNAVSTVSTSLALSKIGFRTADGITISNSTNWLLQFNSSSTNYPPSTALTNRDEAYNFSSVGNGYRSNLSTSEYFRVTFRNSSNVETPLSFNQIYFYNRWESNLGFLLNYNLKVTFSDNTSTQIRISSTNNADTLYWCYEIKPNKTLALVNNILK